MSAVAGLEGKVVLVTGGSRGIGAAISRRFASLGSRVAVVYKSDHAAAAKLADQLAGTDRNCIAVQGDIADIADGPGRAASS